MAASTYTIDVRGIPELVWSVRQAMADMLRREAEAEIDRAVARKLLALAAQFEVGQ